MQFKAEHSIWHSCQLITLKRGNSSNSFDFKEVYSLYRFTEKGEMFVMFNAVNEAVCSAVVTDEGCDICELKNLAVTPQYQRRGYGKRMISYLCNHYADKFRYMTVGTGDSVKTVSFYESCGFSYSHSIPDFFTHSYDHLIIEEGKILKDMLYFKKALFSISPDIEMQK